MTDLDWSQYWRPVLMYYRGPNVPYQEIDGKIVIEGEPSWVTPQVQGDKEGE